MQWGLLYLISIFYVINSICYGQLAQPVILTDQKGQTMFQFAFDGRLKRFFVQPNLRWRSSTYRSMVLAEDGSLIEQDAMGADSHWRLSDVDDGGSGVNHASISVHDGMVTAFISMNDSTNIHITPGNATHHIIQQYDLDSDESLQEPNEQLQSKGKLLAFKQNPVPPTQYNCSLSKPTKYVEVLIVNDFTRYEMLTNWTLAHTMSVVNIADGYYAAASFDDCIRIVLIGQLTFQSGIPSPINYRPCNTSSSSGDKGCWACSDGKDCQKTSIRNDQYDSALLLRSFRQWRIENADLLMEKFGSFDAVHLFSGRDFDGQVRGLAYLDTICKQAISAVAVIESTTRVPSYHAQIFAHELGHNMGLVHDASRGFIMSPASSALTYSTLFSRDSVSLMDSMNLSRCLSSVRQMPVEQICGDGIVDPMEECDPGLDEDDCCINCKIDRPRCNCANTEPCCENGQYKVAGVVCRPSKDNECDHAETCAGNSSQCPGDKFELPSTPCLDYTGTASNCFLGHCVPSRDTQCSSANDPEMFANRLNGLTQLKSQVRSCPTTRLCSRLHCSASADNDCEQVWTSSAADGSPCGPNGPKDASHVCISGYCVDAAEANEKTFWCVNGSNSCVPDDLSVLEKSYWPTIMMALIVIAAVAAFAAVCCCCHKMMPPLRVIRPRSGRLPLASHRLQRQQTAAGG